MYDTVIVGGGLAGLTVARELAKHESVCLLERYKAWGGRAATYRDDTGLQYEIGAGRIYKHHTRVNELVKRYKLHTFPITTDSHYEGVPNTFLDLIQPFLRVIESLSAADLSRHTLGELLPKEMSPILTMYPYMAEIHILRADQALKAFRKEMGASGVSEYYGISEGIDTLATRLATDARKRGADLKNRHRVADIKRIYDTLFEITGTHGKLADSKPFNMRAKRIVIATCRCSLTNFSILAHAPLLKQIATSPLIRIYAVYPKNDDGTVWFAGLPKTVTSGKLRYIIPINEKQGLIMISYTDGQDTEYWRALDDAALETELAKEVAQEFPDRIIPKPTYVKKHDWKSGCSYWLPGNYDVMDASIEAHNPYKNVYVCGESISLNQAWIEGALESAETLLTLL